MTKPRQFTPAPGRIALYAACTDCGWREKIHAGDLAAERHATSRNHTVQISTRPPALSPCRPGHRGHCGLPTCARCKPAQRT